MHRARKRLLAPAIILALTCGATSMAAAESTNVLAGLPKMFQHPLSWSTLTRAIYARAVAKNIDIFDLDYNGLDAKDIERNVSYFGAESRALTVSQVVRYDLDADLRVSEMEVQLGQSNERDQTPVGIAQRIAHIMSRDRDGDGFVTLAEAQLSPRAEEVRKFRDTSLALITRDPNGDGHLSHAEIQEIAGAVFDAIDQDKDGMLSATERAPSKVTQP